MLRSLHAIIGYRVESQDDEFGKVRDFYFDDYAWTIRYIEIDTGTWLPGRRVLIAPSQLGEPDWDRPVLPIELTREQIEQSPPVSSDAPVSRESELLLAKYYGWAAYWETAPMPEPLGRSYAQEATENVREQLERQSNSHLRSVDEVTGYQIIAQDGEIGRVDDVIADTEEWVLRYLVVDTSKWLPAIFSKRVLVAPAWANPDVDWADRGIQVSLTKKEVEECPAYDPSQGINREFEERLYDYYGRPKYWEDETRPP